MGLSKFTAATKNKRRGLESTPAKYNVPGSLNDFPVKPRVQYKLNFTKISRLTAAILRIEVRNNLKCVCNIEPSSVARGC